MGLFDQLKGLKNGTREDLLDFGGRAKLRYDRGVQWFNWAKDIALLVVFINSIKPTLLYYGFDFIVPWLFLILPLGYVFGAYAVGHYDEIKGIWKRQTAYASRQVNPVMANIEEIVSKNNAIVMQLYFNQQEQSQQIDRLGRAVHGVYWDGKD